MARRRAKPTGRNRSRASPPALRVAKNLLDKQRFDEALVKFNEAVRAAPNDLSVLIGASRALGAHYKIDRSRALLERALRLGARRHEVQWAVGESYRMLGQLSAAEACYRRACQLANDPRSQLELAKICERRHRLDEARLLVQQVLRQAPRSSAAHLLTARIARRSGETAKAETILHEVIAAASQDPTVVAEAWGELATLLDSAGEYDAAWNAILACKHQLIGRDQAQRSASDFVLARCRRMVEAITADHFTRWQMSAKKFSPRRVALLTGFPRSGTTLLEQLLDAHPKVVCSEEKDVFSTDIFPSLGAGRPPDTPIEQMLDELSYETILDQRERYLDTMEAIFGEPIGKRLHLDKNPPMILMIPAMKRLFPELKLILALRDPRDVVLSCFLRYLPLNPVSVCFLTIERTCDRYLLDMQAWLKIREMISGAWVEIRYEDAVEDLKREARRALETLELPWDDGVLNYRDRTMQKQVLSPTYEAVAQPIYRSAMGRWKNYQQQLGPILENLAPVVRALGYGD